MRGTGCLARGVTLGVLLTGCGESGVPDDETDPMLGTSIARVVPADEAISGAHVPTLDPMTMFDAEIQEVLGPGPRCEFRYTIASRPVLAVSAASTGDRTDGVVKVNGHLVAVQNSPQGRALVLSAGEIRLTLTPDGGAPFDATGRREANLVFEVAEDLRAGYRGYYDCAERSSSE